MLFGGQSLETHLHPPTRNLHPCATIWATMLPTSSGEIWGASHIGEGTTAVTPAELWDSA
jgi:hypothetical protein